VRQLKILETETCFSNVVDTECGCTTVITIIQFSGE